VCVLEFKKVNRHLVQLRSRLHSLETGKEEKKLIPNFISSLDKTACEELIKEYEDNLLYINVCIFKNNRCLIFKEFPVDWKYVSLFPPPLLSEDEKQKRKEERTKILEEIKKRKENGNNEEEEVIEKSEEENEDEVKDEEENEDEMKDEDEFFIENINKTSFQKSKRKKIE
jgi:hypothetical protein